MTSTRSRLNGTVRNPFDPSLTPGGSAGGCAAAIAAGIGHIGIATDATGSIRVPAAFTGTVGVKPSNAMSTEVGRLGTNDMGIGTITRTVEDAAIALDATAFGTGGPVSAASVFYSGGTAADHVHDLHKPHGRPVSTLPVAAHVGPLERRVRAVREGFPRPASSHPAADSTQRHPLRVAYLPYFPWMKDVQDPLITAALDSQVAVMRSQGWGIQVVSGLGFDDPHEHAAVLWAEIIKLHHVRCFKRFPTGDMDPWVASVVKRHSASTTPAMVAAALAARKAVIAALMEVFSVYDALLLPAAAVLPWAADQALPPVPPALQGQYDEGRDFAWWSPYSYPFNWANLTCGVVPCGLVSRPGHLHDLPVGMQVVVAPEKSQDGAARRLELAPLLKVLAWVEASNRTTMEDNYPTFMDLRYKDGL